MAYSLHKIPLFHKDYEDELNIIKWLDETSGYDRALTDKCLRKKNLKQTTGKWWKPPILTTILEKLFAH